MVSVGWRRLPSRAVLVVLAVRAGRGRLLSSPACGSAVAASAGDAAFYAYQLTRAAECHGQWWRVAEDGRLGHPYPSEFAKHPGLFEGVDLMLLATLFAGALSSAGTYHLGVMAALAFNGWIAGWIVLRRSTRSALWAIVAVALITLNESVAVRVLVHLHLFKFGWALLAVWAFVAFLRQPLWWRGLILGLAVALELQASFYLGFFTAFGLGFWYAVELVAGRGRASRAGTCILAALARPWWRPHFSASRSGPTIRRSSDPTSTSIATGPRRGSMGAKCGNISSPRTRGWPANYFRDLRHKVPAPIMDEGWNFPGYTVLVAVLVAGVAWLRGSELSRKLHPFVWVAWD